MSTIKLLKLGYTEVPGLLSATQLSEHYKLYEGYYNGANDLPQKINGVGASDNPGAIRGLQRNLQYALAGRELHEVYFDQISVEETSTSDMPTKLVETVTESFGSVETFMSDMAAAAATCRGWYRVEQDLRTGQLYHNVGDFHDEAFTPGFGLVIALDMYDHAYFFDYQTNKKEYIANYIKHLDWNKVAARLA